MTSSNGQVVQSVSQSVIALLFSWSEHNWVHQGNIHLHLHCLFFQNRSKTQAT